MDVTNLHAAPGSRKKSRRVGRGHGSGRGKTAGKGTKGQKARAGGGVPAHFQGGTLGLVHGLPMKRGIHFRGPYGKVRPEAINVAALEKFAPNSVVNLESLIGAGLIDNAARAVKILGEGELTRPLTVEATAFSESARQKIEQAGGTAVQVGGEPKSQES
ncbi:MAG TPA: 50S ribosomal protein L15 [Chloroflexota bacterium]|nr:50S ribosomal protein L15 [Chloroflexota bacterium]